MGTVYYFDNTMANAPVLTGADGAMLQILDACLCNGFGTVTVDALTVVDEIATATVSTGHGLAMYSDSALGPVIEISGATPDALNGQHRVTAVTNAAIFSFAVSGATDGTASGTITAKRAAPGWQKVFSGTSKAAYRPPAGSRLYLRADDTGALEHAGYYGYCTLVRGYEQMTDVDTGINPFPTPAQKGTKAWMKSYNNTSSARAWRLFADDSRMLLFANWYGDSKLEPYLFGDLVSYRAADTHPCLISGSESFYRYGNPNTGHYNETLVNYGTTRPSYIARETSLLAQPRAAHPLCVESTGAPLGSTATAQYPNPSDGALHLRGPVEWLVFDSDNDLRGYWPGLYYPLHNTPMIDGAVISGAAGLEGRALMGVRIGGDDVTSVRTGQVFIDLADWS